MRSSWVVALYMAGYAGWQLSGLGGAESRVVVGDLLITTFNTGVALLVWRASRRSGATPRVRSAWRLIAIGLSFYCVGNALQAYYEIVAHSKPYPSLADPAFLLLYPFAIAGLLRFPRAKESAVQRVHTLVDCATVAIAGSAVVWYVVLGPATLAGGTPIQTLVTIAYPVADLVLIAALATALLRRTVRESSGALRFVGAGFVFLVAADLVYGSLSLTGSYSGGDPVDGLYLVAIGLLAIAAGRHSLGAAPDALAAPVMRRTSWIPWLGVVLVFGLLVLATRHDDFVPMGGLLASAIGVTFLVAMRQFLAQRELLRTHAELERAHAELAAIAVTDPVTLLPNHRGAITAVTQAVARCRRGDRSCALLFIDIDRFKKFNDTFGHAAGDAALREFGSVARSSLRTADTIGRWGGEEFVAVLDDLDAANALEVAERLRTTVAEHPLKAAVGAQLTCSIGVAAYPSDGLTGAELIEAADRAMYGAKHSGRNRVRAASDPSVAAHLGDPEPDLLFEGFGSDTDAHASGVGELSGRIAIELGCDEAEQAAIVRAGRLHDIGKVAVPDAILAKPGPLTEEELVVMRTHPVVGAELLAQVSGLRPIAPLVRAHHERWDGGGYPDGLAGEEIPFGARIIGAADAFDAMLDDRPYQKAMSVDAALHELRDRAGTQFDERVVDALERTVRSRQAGRSAARTWS